MRGPGRRAQVQINATTLGDNELVAASTIGAHYEIDFIQVLPSGGGQTVTLTDGTVTVFSYPLDDNQAVSFDSGSGDYPIVLTSNSAMTLNLSAATQVDGFVLYRVVGGND